MSKILHISGGGVERGITTKDAKVHEGNLMILLRCCGEGFAMGDFFSISFLCAAQSSSSRVRPEG